MFTGAYVDLCAIAVRSVDDVEVSTALLHGFDVFGGTMGLAALHDCVSVQAGLSGLSLQKCVSVEAGWLRGRVSVSVGLSGLSNRICASVSVGLSGLSLGECLSA